MAGPRLVCKSLQTMIGQVVNPRKVSQIQEEKDEMYQSWLADRLTPMEGCPGCMDPDIGPGVAHKKHHDRTNGCTRDFSMSFEEVYRNYCGRKTWLLIVPQQMATEQCSLLHGTVTF